MIMLKSVLFCDDGKLFGLCDRLFAVCHLLCFPLISLWLFGYHFSSFSFRHKHVRAASREDVMFWYTNSAQMKEMSRNTDKRSTKRGTERTGHAVSKRATKKKLNNNNKKTCTHFFFIRMYMHNKRATE